MSPGPQDPKSTQSRLANAALSVVVTLVLLGVLEGGARVIEARRPPPVIADYIWNWERKWDGDFYTLRSEGVGWPPWEEFNADGLRDRTRPHEHPEGMTRIAFLGDSVTLGAGIQPADAFPQRLQQRFAAEGRPVDVMNVALWGWSTRQERLAYERLARRYAPDQVALAVCLNDIPELQNNLTRPPRFLSALHARSALVRVAVNAQGREIGTVEQLFAQPAPAKVDEAFSRFFTEVRQLRDEARADGHGFAMIVLPFRFQVEQGAPPPVAQQRIAAFCGADAIPCLDLLPALQPLGPAAFVDYDHLSPRGADRVADAILARGLLALPKTHVETLAAAWPSGAGTLDWAIEPPPPVHEDAPAPQAAPHDKDAEAEPLAPPPAAAPRPKAPPSAIAPLAGLVDAPDPAVRAAACWALGRSGLAAAVPPLAAALADPAEQVRRETATALGALGEQARPQVPRLFAALRDPKENVRAAAAQALHAIEPGAADVDALAVAVASDDPYVRGFSAWTLGGLGKAAAPALPALIDALRRPDGYGRGGAASALAKMGPEAAPAVPALIEGLRDPDGDRRWKAARTLGRVGKGAAAAVPALTAALSDPNEYVRTNAARALGRIGPAARTAAAALERARADPDEAVRKEAQDALDRLGH